jgi:hypothetical protein
MSPHRQFLDDDGLPWQAWDVIPSWGERRIQQRRQQLTSPPPGTGERRIAERRTRHGIRIGLTERLAEGWLAFESRGLRRRVAPIPEDWHELTDDALRTMLREAEQLPPRRGRLIE